MEPRRFETAEAGWLNFCRRIADCVLTRVAGGLISAAPRGETLRGMLFEIVEKREGMRGRRPRVA